MGLDIVEYIMAVEEAFELALPHDRLGVVRSPRDLADLVAEFVAGAESGPCLSQRAFYQLRRAMLNRTDVPRRAIRPEAVLEDLLPTATASEFWVAICADLELPRPLELRGRRDGLLAFLGSGPNTFGEAVNELMMRYPGRLLRAGEGWTTAQIHSVLAPLLDREQGLSPGSYSLDASYVHDLHMD